MFPEAVAGAFDADHNGVMQQPVEQCGGDHRVAEHLTPFGEAAVGGEHHGALLVACADQLEEQVGAFPGQGQVADLVDDQQCGPGVEAQLGGELSGAVGQRQRVDQFGQGAAVDAFAGLDGGHAECAGQVALAGAGRAQEQHRFAAADDA